MQRKLTTWGPIVMLTVLGCIAGMGRFIEERIEADPDDGVPAEIIVSSSADRGPGSLRAAIFLATKADHPVAIFLQAKEINLELPLPPIVPARGLTIEGQLPDPTVLFNTSDTEFDAPLLRIIGDDVQLRNIEIDAQSADGLFSIGSRFTIDNVTIRNATRAMRSIDPQQLAIRDSAFIDNIDGLRLEGTEGNASILNSTFTANSGASLWSVFSDPAKEATNKVVVFDNRFRTGKYAVVAANASIELRNNRLSGFSDAGFTILQSKATVIDNRVTDNSGIGIHLVNSRDSLVSGNEVGRNTLVGTLILDPLSLQVISNQFYRNGYGIVSVGRVPTSAALRNNTFVDHTLDGLISIGETPLIDGNHLRGNRLAGIRVLDLLMSDDTLVPSSPRYANNIFGNNGNDEIQFGQYAVN